MDIYVNERTLADIMRWAEMEKQAVVKPGVTPDLEPKCNCVKAREKRAKEEQEKQEIERLAQQDAATRLAEDAQ
jgi:hypothetical protein